MKRLFLVCGGLTVLALAGCGGGSSVGPGKDAGPPDHAGDAGDGSQLQDGAPSETPNLGSGGRVGGSGGGGGGMSGASGTAGAASGGAAAGAGSGGAVGGAGGISACGTSPACTVDAVRCQAGLPQQCVRDALGCAVWKSLAACGAHQSCTEGACSCVAEPRCGGVLAMEGDFCPAAGGNTFGHCAKDADNCIFVAASNNPCSNAQTCNALGVVSTGLACGCPADGTTVGTGCSQRQIGNTAADTAGSSILSCESVGSCQVWRAQVNCGATGMMVAALNGVPVCVCRPATDGTYYVDPSPSMAMYMNGSPTGASLPPACRLRSIKDALAHVATGGGFNKVVVAHEFSTASPAPVHLGVSTGESFPLVIPAGVTVTTAEEPTFNPAHFVVDVGDVGSAHCAVKLEDAAVLSGVTINARGAAAAPSGGLGVENVISCAEPDAAQTATLNHVAVAAQDGQTGILAGGSCAITADDVNVDGAWLGVDVARTATAGSAEARLISRRLGVSSTVTGSIGVRVGTGLDGGARSSAVLNAASLSTRNIGLSVSGGTVTCDGGSISVANPSTEQTVGADLGGGTVLLSGTNISGAANFTGVEISGGSQVTLQANASAPARITTTLAANATDAADGVVVAPAATAARLTIAGGTEITRFHSGLVMNDGSLLMQGANVLIKSNRANGMELLGRNAGVTVTVSAGTIADNAGTGLVVRTTVPSTVQNLVITGNGQDGVELQRTQTAAQSGYRLVFAANTVSGNSGRGIAVTGKGAGAGALAGGKVGVRLERNIVSGNAAVGLYITESADAADGDDITEVSLDSNDVAGNLTSAATAPASVLAGGIFFARTDATTRILLGSFLGNRVHGNGRHEIAFDLAQDGGAAWNLSSNASAVDMATGCADAAKPNSVYCYDSIMGQDLGVAVSSATIHVNVQNMHFQNAAPLAGRDYSLSIPMSEVTVPCAPLLCQ